MYGEPAVLGKAATVQHIGIGKYLIGLAESLAIQDGAKKLKVISGVGVRPYYRKLGYRKCGHYMCKPL